MTFKHSIGRGGSRSINDSSVARGGGVRAAPGAERGAKRPGPLPAARPNNQENEQRISGKTIPHPNNGPRDGKRF